MHYRPDPGPALQKPLMLIIILAMAAAFIVVAGCTAKGASSGHPANAGVRIITEELPPFNYYGSDGKVTGQATEVVETILSRLNQTAGIEILPWSKGYQAAITGPRVALYSTGRTEEREHLFKWVGPVVSYEFMLYARNGSGLTIPGPDEAKSAGKIWVVKDDTRHQYLLHQNFTNIATCDIDAGCLANLLAGKSDLWLGTTANTPEILRKAGVDPIAITPVYSIGEGTAYIAFSNDTPDSVIASWQGTLDGMKQDGTFAQIQQKYNMSTGS